MKNYCKVDAVRCLQRMCKLVTVYAKNAEGSFIDETKWVGTVRLVIPASSISLYLKDAAVDTEESSVESTVNYGSVRTPRKNLSRFTNNILPVLSVGKTKAT